MSSLNNVIRLYNKTGKNSSRKHALYTKANFVGNYYKANLTQWLRLATQINF